MDISNEFSESHQNAQAQLIKHLFGLFIRHKWTLTSLEDTAKLMNSMPGAQINIPATKYLLIKQLLSISNIIAKQHYLCTPCDRYTKFEFSIDPKTKKCEYCNEKLGSDFFVSFNLKEQIGSIIDAHFDNIKQFRESVKDSTYVTDIYGSAYTKKIMERNERLIQTPHHYGQF